MWLDIIMNLLVVKDTCKKFALQYKQETGKFPKAHDWVVSKGFPYSSLKLLKLFDRSYNNFREYCGEDDLIYRNCKYSLTKKDLKLAAIDYKVKTGKFPTQIEWTMRNGFPCGIMTLKKYFNNSYDYFREYCGEKRFNRGTAEITLEWLKSNCIVDDNQCWNWCKSLSNGYGHTTYQQKSISTHVLAFILTNNVPNKGYVIRHTCHNKKCCNPEHLQEGTHSENQIDSIHYSKTAKLSSQDVILIKKDFHNWKLDLFGEKSKFDKFWANKLKVSQATISSIRTGKTWSHIKIC